MNKKTDKPHEVALRVSRLQPDVYDSLKKEADALGVSVTVLVAIILTKHVRGNKGS